MMAVSFDVGYGTVVMVYTASVSRERVDDVVSVSGRGGEDLP